MVHSTQRNYEFFKLNYISAEQKIEVNQINEIHIYEVNNAETTHAFYSLNPHILHMQSYKEYSKTYLS